MTDGGIEASIVLPCLNEENTLAQCIRDARQALDDGGIQGEIVIADNGSTDRSREIARAEGARVVEVRERGYGSALRSGIASAQGRYIVFLDADLSYDFADVPRFVEELRKGAGLVMGSRLRGDIDRGAMPLLHRLVGTPALTLLANVLFGSGISDINCGMRGLTKETFEHLDLACEGMEFASEMVIKAARGKTPIKEIPIVFHADKRGRPPHLRSFRDGWRHLHLMLHYCPMWLLLGPGVVLALGGFAVILAVLSGLSPPAGVLTYLVAHSATIVGVQILLLGLVAQDRVRNPRWRSYRFAHSVRKWFTLGKGLMLGSGVALAGVAFIAYAAVQAATGSGGNAHAVIRFDAASTKYALLGATLFISGLQVAFTALFLGLFGIVADTQEIDAAD